MTAPLTVSAVQYEALDGGIDANVPEHVRLIEDADSHGARLVVFPELSLTGYDLRLLRHGNQRGDDQRGGDQWVTAGDHRLDPIREICRPGWLPVPIQGPPPEHGGDHFRSGAARALHGEPVRAPETYR